MWKCIKLNKASDYWRGNIIYLFFLKLLRSQLWLWLVTTTGLSGFFTPITFFELLLSDSKVRFLVRNEGFDCPKHELYAHFFQRQLKNHQNKRCYWPGSVRTSFAEAMSINFFSASFFSLSNWKLSGCHCCASFLYAFRISCLFAFLKEERIGGLLLAFKKHGQWRICVRLGTCRRPGSYSNPSCGKFSAASVLVPDPLWFPGYRQTLEPLGSPPRLLTNAGLKLNTITLPLWWFPQI